MCDIWADVVTLKHIVSGLEQSKGIEWVEAGECLAPTVDLAEIIQGISVSSGSYPMPVLC